MIQHSLPLPRHRLSVTLVRRHRSKNDVPLKKHLQAILNVRKGSSLSRLARLVFENRNIKLFLGIQLATATILLPTFNSLAPARAEPAETTLIHTPPVLTTTPSSVRYPVDKPQISQGYSPSHPAIDLRGPEGTPIYPVMAGKIILAQPSLFGYGNHILIAHPKGYQSLYAHLSQINVRPHDQVTTQTIIGLMGNTGYTTGNHLHIELYQNGQIINPFTLLGNP